MSVDAPTPAEEAVSEARRAIDNAIRTMFELATRLEQLGEALEQAKTEARAVVDSASDNYSTQTRAISVD